jgi:hexokinase
VKEFDIPLASLKEVESLLTAEFTRGLKSEGEDVKVKMFVTHVYEMPKGTEEGDFLVVDWGINHLRVVHISELTYNILFSESVI